MTEQVKFKTKSKTKAGLLAIFLGFLGIHNFYLGHYKKAIVQLIIGGIFFILGTIGLVVGIILFLVSILFTLFSGGLFIIVTGSIFEVAFLGCLFYIGCIPTLIWSWIEAILIFSGKIETDAYGVALK